MPNMIYARSVSAEEREMAKILVYSVVLASALGDVSERMRELAGIHLPEDFSAYVPADAYELMKQIFSAADVRDDGFSLMVAEGLQRVLAHRIAAPRCVPN